MLAIQPFLTAYDPSDLPGSSVDPLGFDRGYQLLAGKILPGLTNVANKPRYLSVLCAGVVLADDAAGAENETPRARYQRRLETVQRLERFWTLACVLASRADEPLDSSGVRGIRYVQAAVRRIDERGDTSTRADFRLLSRQVTYGLVGIYGTVADGLKLVDRSVLGLGSELGAPLGNAFISETALPSVLKRAVTQGGDVGISTLTSWGERAHISAVGGEREAKVLLEALNANDTRRRMAELLQRHPLAEDEQELHRLERVIQSLAATEDHPDLREALRAILAYEECFRLCLLVFFRLLWFCQEEEFVDLARLAEDDVLVRAHAALTDKWARLDAALAEGRTTAFIEGLDRIQDARAFVQGAASVRGADGLVEYVLARHREVQRAKLDGGRPKMPWLEIRGTKVAPTLTLAQRIGREPTQPSNVAAHPYRTGAVDGFVALGGER